MVMFILIITTISLFKSVNSVQTWSSQGSVDPQPYPRKVDLDLCMMWPSKRAQPQGLSILEFDVEKCKANEICTPTQPETKIHGLILGRCKVLIDPPKSTTKQSMVTLVVTGQHSTSRQQTVEIIKENFETEVCYNVQEYPFPVLSAAGSSWDDGKVTICGGRVWSLELARIRPTSHNECYSLDNGEWKLNSQKLQIGRTALAASNLGNSIWITGGYSQSYWTGRSYRQYGFIRNTSIRND